MINMPVEVFLIGGEKTIHLKKAIARILYSKKIEQSKISEILNFLNQWLATTAVQMKKYQITY